jgi:hypothetical protein
MIESTSAPSFNGKAILGFITAMFALLALCTGLLPVPFTILICYPPGIIFGIASLMLGIQAQREIRQSNENGRLLALISAWIGAITIIVMLCLITTGILLYPYIIKFIQQVWGQIHSN